ncbi:(+)-delta-cadinene synthase isozyme XC14 [Hibiscus syriacus]|uniref:(+)-delta-cadinene synthase isozyme XC14 n=1 Tax=Hibiscus syriacus TaxID=106335 RepID=A0A6A2XYL3_HIBSY|nr:(+)-delta-cadinene synthase isozyme A-like [Hibiscus syriacus]KAE8675500.1 (+)-delta-cadinene synthase isozyme XC14 [Hibiscus syriacus]
MSSQVSADLVPVQDNNMSKENWHLADFDPDMWGDIILSSPAETDMDAGTQLEYEELKEEVRRMVVTNMDKPSQKVHVIDAVQRLGVAYHFEKEIEEALQIINHAQVDDDLYTTAVRFRLLREHGFNVHCDTFNKFKDENGKFKESLIGDVKGILELYEAANFQVHGDNILEEALSFTKFHLKLAEPKADYPLSTQIVDALNRPLLKSLPRVVARTYIPIYEGYGTLDQNLLKFAKLDFRTVQHVHKEEIRR